MRTFYPDREALTSLLPGRTWAAILERAKHLRCQRVARRFSPDEILVARIVSDNLGLKAAAQRLGRTARSISALRCRLGLTKKHGEPRHPDPQFLVDLRQGAADSGRSIQEVGLSINRPGILAFRARMPICRGLFDAADELGGTIYAEWED